MASGVGHSDFDWAYERGGAPWDTGRSQPAIPALADLGGPFDVIIDTGLFHVFGDDDHVRYVGSLANLSHPGTMYYLLCFSDRHPGEWGPRRIARHEITNAFAEGWTVQAIVEAEFELTIPPGRAASWLARITRT